MFRMQPVSTRGLVWSMLLLGSVFCSAPVALSADISLQDGDGYRWDIDADGYGHVIDGSFDAYDLWPDLCVRAASASGETCTPEETYLVSSDAGLEMNSRQIVMASMTLGSVSVRRKIYVPDSGIGFARFMEIIFNPSIRAQVVTVRIGSVAESMSQLGSGGATIITSSSDGNGTLDAADDWWCSDDGTDGGGTPAMTHVVAGDGARHSVDAVLSNASSNGNGSIYWEYQNITIQARSTVTLLHFEGQAANRANAAATALALYDQPVSILAGMTSAEVDSIVNWRLDVLPVADAGGPYSGTEGTPVTLNASGSSDPNADIALYQWDCTNDGTFDIESVSPTEATCTYPDEGTYTLRLLVTDRTGFTAEDTANVTITNVAPTLEVFTYPAGGNEGATLSFTAEAYDPGVDDRLTYAWDFGDGTTSSSASPTKVYVDEGIFTLTLTVTDGDGGRVSDGGVITIENAPPEIFTLNVPASEFEGTEIDFDAYASDPGVEDSLSYEWDFGDGAQQTGFDLSAVQHTYYQEGNYLLRLTVTDDSDASDSSTASLTIRNAAPVIQDILGDLEGNEGSTFSFEAVASDAGNDPLTYSWQFGDGTTGSGASVSHTYSDDGSFALVLTVSDDEDATATSSETVRVLNVSPAIVSIGGPNTGTEGSTLNFTVSASDPGDDTITYQWDFGDGGTDEGSEVSYSYADDGDYLLTLTASDEDGGESSATLDIRIDNVDPSINGPSGPTTGNQGQLLTYSATASDPGDDVLTFSWDFGDDSTLSGEDLTEVTHTYTGPGAYTLSLTVSDEDGGSATAFRTVNIDNGAPGIDTIDAPSTATEGQTLSLSADASDPGGDTLTYSWDFGDGSPNESDEELSALTHVYADDGDYTLTLRVEDPGGLSAEASMDISVRNANPSIDDVTVPTSADEGELVTFDAVASDPGTLDVLTYTWEFGDDSLDYEGTPATHIYDQNGQYTLRLTVRDDDGGSANRTFNLEASNVAPAIEAIDGPRNLNEGQTGTWSAEVVEPGNDTLSFNWDFGDGRTSTAQTPSHAYGHEGLYTLSLTVTDQDGASVTESLEVGVTNVAPSISAVSIPAAGDEGEVLTFSVEASDPGDGSLTISWTFGDGRGASGPSVTHAYADNGVYQVTATVRDDYGGQTSANGSLTVANVAPIVEVPELPSEAEEGAIIEARTTWSDPGTADTLVASITWGDGISSTATLESPVEHAYADEGTYEVRTKVADDDGAISTSDAALIQVTNVPPTITQFTGTLYGQVGESFTFSATASDPGLNDVLTFVFDWGDDSEPESAIDTSSASHQYAESGQYTVTLSVQDGDGGEDSDSLTVNVGTGAPYINGFVVPASGNEGETLSFQGTGIDPSGQDLTYTWDFGDGTAPLEGADLPQVTHTYADNGSYTVVLTVTDIDGLRALMSRQTEIANVAPVFSSSPPTTATEGVLYEHLFQVFDPAGSADPLTFALLEAPEGMTLSEDGQVQWTPTTSQAQEGAASYVITVSDGDGGEDAKTVELEVQLSDLDGDGMSDNWETSFGLDPTRDDAGEDPDGDGLTNLEEFLNGTDPTGSNAPTEPIPLSPRDNTEVSQTPIDLVIANASDPDGDSMTYSFELYEDAALSVLASAEEGIVEQDTQTTWTPDLEWVEDQHYWWRARAYDGQSYGPWSENVDFRVNVVNDPPSIPAPSYPDDGAIVEEIYPRLEVGNASDPDGGSLTYTFEVFLSRGTLVTSVEGLPEDADGTTEWTVDVALQVGESYRWRAQAVDLGGLTGGWCDWAEFLIDAGNSPPAAPTAVSPIEGERVQTRTPTLVVQNGQDPDDDPLTYRFQVDSTQSFDSMDLQDSGDIVEGAVGRTSWTVSKALTENQGYYWRAQADDGVSTSDWATADFFVDVTNQPPGVPTLQNPSNGSQVKEGAFTLSLVSVEDPEGDDVTYTFLIRTTGGDEVFRDEGVAPPAEGLVTSTLDTSELPLETDTFDWTAFGTDARGGEGEEAVPNRFTIERENGDDDTPGDDDTASDDDVSGDDDISGDDDSDEDQGSCICGSSTGGHAQGELLLLFGGYALLACRRFSWRGNG